MEQKPEQGTIYRKRTVRLVEEVSKSNLQGPKGAIRETRLKR